VINHLASSSLDLAAAMNASAKAQTSGSVMAKVPASIKLICKRVSVNFSTVNSRFHRMYGLRKPARAIFNIFSSVSLVNCRIVKTSSLSMMGKATCTYHIVLHVMIILRYEGQHGIQTPLMVPRSTPPKDNALSENDLNRHLRRIDQALVHLTPSAPDHSCLCLNHT
jgi:hypothetical protein